MPLNRNTLIRLTTIDRCLQNRYRRWTLDDLIEACSEALYEFEGIATGVSRRTVQSDIQLMRSEKLGYNAPIVVVDRKYYTYDDPNYSITNIPLSDQDVSTLSQAMDILKHFQVFSQFSPIADIINKLEDHIAVTISNHTPAIHLEKNDRLKGLNFVSEIYQSIVDRRAIDLHYQSFKSVKPREYIISPYLLKEYRNRWFVICYDEYSGGLRNYALDRINSIVHSKDFVYRDNTFFNPETYFDDIIGVTKNAGSHPEKIRLWVDNSEAPYMLTKPMHSSQRLIETTDSGIIIEIEVCHNFELEREIISYAEGIEVLSPRLLRHRISRKLQIANLRYSNE